MLRSDADLFVILPVVLLVLLKAVAGFEATGAGIRRRDGAAGKGTVLSWAECDPVLRSDADLFVPIPVGSLVLLGAVLSLLAMGAGLRGRDGAVGEGTLLSCVSCGQLCGRRGVGRGLAIFSSWGHWVCVEGVEGGLVGYECA